MAEIAKKISEVPEKTTPVGTDSVVIREGTTNKRVALSNLPKAMANMVDILEDQYNPVQVGKLVQFHYTGSSPRVDWRITGNNAPIENYTGLLGISFQPSTEENADGRVLVQGIFTTSGLDPANPTYYLGTEGSITNVRPTASGKIIRIVGYALSATQFWFNPSKEWMEIK